MTANGDPKAPSLDFGCYCGFVTVLDADPEDGMTGECANCSRKFTISRLDGQLRAEWAAVFTKVVVFDLDGTIRYAPGKPWPMTADEVRIFPDVLEKLDQFIEEGYFIVALTNQAGPAMGQARLVDVQSALAVTMQELYPRLHMAQASFGHPDATVESFRYRSFLRKPYIGMLAVVEQTMIEEAGFVPDWDRSLIVGDSDADLELAKAAGVAFTWAWDFFGRPDPQHGRSPECKYCMDQDDDVDPQPVHDGEDWIHVEGENIVMCQDQHWYIGRHG